MHDEQNWAKKMSGVDHDALLEHAVHLDSAVVVVDHNFHGKECHIDFSFNTIFVDGIFI